ncbi:MAG: amidohydrolase family protein [Candidatus Bipolaricaulota bacterium]
MLGAFPELKLILAHFPMGRREHERRDATVDLVLKYENAYLDIPCWATSEKYYRGLRKLLDGLSEGDTRKLKARILFGSDFAVSLMWIDSYNCYVGLFSDTQALTPEEKQAFCSRNPERFLFRG